MNNLPSPFDNGGPNRGHRMGSPNTPPPFFFMNRSPYRSPHSTNFSSTPVRPYNNIRTPHSGFRNNFRGRSPRMPYSRPPRHESPYSNSKSPSPSQAPYARHQSPYSNSKSPSTSQAPYARQQSPYSNSNSPSPSQNFLRRNTNNTPLASVPISKFITNAMTCNPWETLEREKRNESSNVDVVPEQVECKDSQSLSE